MLDLRVQDYAWGKQDYRIRTHKHFHDMAYPIDRDAAQTLTLDQLAARMKAALSG